MYSCVAWRRGMCSLLVSLGVVVPSIRSQTPRPEEIKSHLHEALEEILKDIDRGQRDRVFLDLETVWNGDLPLKKEQVASRLAEKWSREGRGLTRNDSVFEALSGPPDDPVHAASIEQGRPSVYAILEPELKTATALVDSLSSVMRRRSVVAEIGPTTSKELDHTQLRDYLKETASVPDYIQVADSFDPKFLAEVVIFGQPTKLFRLYGGDSNALGRYWSCCFWDSGHPPDAQGAAHWTEAIGLALPPGNLRDRLAVVTIEPGTPAIVGVVADNFRDQFGKLERGGNIQIFFHSAPKSVFEVFQIAGDKSKAFEVAVQLDDRLLRFRRSGVE